MNILAVLAVMLIFFVMSALAVFVAPAAILVHFGYPRLALGTAILTTAALTIDSFFNFDGIEYLHWFLRIFTETYLFSLLFAADGLALGVKACARLIGGSADDLD